MIHRTNALRPKAKNSNTSKLVEYIVHLDKVIAMQIVIYLRTSLVFIKDFEIENVASFS